MQAKCESCLPKRQAEIQVFFLALITYTKNTYNADFYMPHLTKNILIKEKNKKLMKIFDERKKNSALLILRRIKTLLLGRNPPLTILELIILKMLV